MTPILDWEIYVKKLAGEPLRSKAIQANTQRFAPRMLGEGYTMADVGKIVLFFVRQMAAVGRMLPAGGAFDLDLMAKQDPVARRGITMSEEQATSLEASTPEEPSDNFEGLAT